MNPYVLQIIIICVLVLCIYVGSKHNKNIGLLGIAFGYLIASFLMNKSMSQFVDYWPISLTFAQIATSYFFGFANKNGTMQILASYFLYPFRKFPKLVPIGLFLVSSLLCAMGTSTIAVVVLMSTIAVQICEAADVDPLLLVLAVVMGCPAGNSVPWGEAGIMLKGYIDAIYTQDIATNYSNRLSVVLFCSIFVLCIIMYFIYKGYNCTFSDFKKPKKFNKKQKTTLVIVITVLAFALVPGIVNKLYPNEVCKFLTLHLDIRALSFVGGAICTLLNLYDEKEVISQMPWNTILMIAGISILIEMGTDAGMMATLSDILSLRNMPIWILLGVLTCVGALLSVFGNSILVVGIMIPVAQALMNAYSVSSPFSFLATAALGAYMADFAPFSTGGALVLSAFKDDERKERLFTRFTKNCFLIIGLVTVMSMLGWTYLF